VKTALLIPGLGGTADCWSDLFLGRLGSVYSITSTALPFSGSTIPEFAEVLMPDDPPDLIIGFSMGAAVVQEILAVNPEAASKAVLLASPAGNKYPPAPEDAHDFSDGRGRWSSKMLEMMFTPDWLAAHPDVSEFFPRVKNPIPGERLIIQSNAIHDWGGCTEKLEKVHTPVLILAGFYDIITPVVHAEALHSCLPCSKLEIMETGHGFPWQCPVETADRILEFTL